MPYKLAQDTKALAGEKGYLGIESIQELRCALPVPVNGGPARLLGAWQRHAVLLAEGRCDMELMRAAQRH